MNFVSIMAYIMDLGRMATCQVLVLPGSMVFAIVSVHVCRNVILLGFRTPKGLL